MNIPPSVFTVHPYESIFQKTEMEIIAANIMKIRDRLGKWDISLEEYCVEREKDGNLSWMETSYFKEVIEKIPDAISAIGFSQSWTKAAREYSKKNP